MYFFIQIILTYSFYIDIIFCIMLYFLLYFNYFSHNISDIAKSTIYSSSWQPCHFKQYENYNNKVSSFNSSRSLNLEKKMNFDCFFFQRIILKQRKSWKRRSLNFGNACKNQEWIFFKLLDTINKRNINI